MASDLPNRAVLLRHRRRPLLLVCGLLLPYAALDIAKPHTALSLSTRAVWVFALLCAVALQRREAWADVAARVAGAVTGVACDLIVAVHGGPAGVYAGMLAAAPFAVSMIFPDLPSTSVLTGIATGVGGTVLFWREGSSAADVGEWVVFSAAMSCLAVWSHVLYGRAWRSAEAAQDERARALEDLASSERRRADSERLAVVGRLAAGVAHEINNPLAYVKSNAEWLRENIGGGAFDRAEAEEVLAETVGGAERIARIVDDLRAFARRDDELAGPCDVGAVVRDAVRLASVRLKSLDEVTIRIAPDLPRAQADGHRVAQALVNLLLNASDAVEASARRAAGARGIVQVNAEREGDSVAIAVEDSGDGLGDAAAHLFEPFYSTKGARGTGLGLAVSRENLARFGGTLDAEAAAMGGARFTIRLRAAP